MKWLLPIYLTFLLPFHLKPFEESTSKTIYGSDYSFYFSQLVLCYVLPSLHKVSRVPKCRHKVATQQLAQSPLFIRAKRGLFVSCRTMAADFPMCKSVYITRSSKENEKVCGTLTGQCQKKKRVIKHSGLVWSMLKKCKWQHLHKERSLPESLTVCDFRIYSPGHCNANISD